MRKRSIAILIVIIFLIGLLGLVVVNGFDLGVYEVRPLNGIKQGLDLTGGVYTVYQAKDTTIENFKDKMSGAMLVLRNRLDAKGYTEATITEQGDDRIRVEIPINASSEIKDPNEVSKFIGSPAKLEFVGPDGVAILEGKDIKLAQARQGETGPVVAFELSEDGTKAFATATQKFLGQPISITLDGEVISSPNVKSAILTGSGVIESDTFTNESAMNLALQIESGALPLELEEIEVRSISATLGFNALESSIYAGIIGLLILFAYMLILYRVPGIVACMALLVYICIVLLLLGSVPGVQLTLPGIAGIILGIGMAVDANVIIFERFKEEIKTGKTLRSSLKAGFHKAFTTILDSNITTLICAIVLAIFGTGTIKSFAYTLIISIVVSMISAVGITRGLLHLFININFKNPNVFMKNAKKFREIAEIESANGGAKQ